MVLFTSFAPLGSWLNPFNHVLHRHSGNQQCCEEKKITSPKNKKAELTVGLSFGSSAIFVLKIRCFPSPPHERFGFIGIKIF
jgi:hypothetical protein